VAEVAIFVNEKSKINPKDPARATVHNFRPKKHKLTGRLEKSSSCLEELDEAMKWETLQRGSIRPVLGRAELAADHVREVEGLCLEADWEPERHVNILGWDDDHGSLATRAQALYVRHRFVLKPQE
jgi:hypothetical protein